MKKIRKIGMFLITVIISLVMIAIIWFLNSKEIDIAVGIGWTVIGIWLPVVLRKLIDCVDTKSWQSDLRKLMRGNEIKGNDKIRISFAYLYRIKVDDKYLLVLNGRGTKKYQPVGGAYQYNNDEMYYMCNKFKVAEDNKIKRDETSKNDYRLYVAAKYLRKFVNRFNNKRSMRERIDNLSREFCEELISTGILDFKEIKYRYCGRHYTKIIYSRHFECYELLMADIVELLPSQSQIAKLRELSNSISSKYRFVTYKEIKTCGIQEGTEFLEENISDHSFKILQETEIDLERARKQGNIFQVLLENR